MGLLLSCGCVSTTVSLHHLDFNETPEKKNLDENYTRIPHAVLHKSWKQQLIKQQLYGHLPPNKPSK